MKLQKKKRPNGSQNTSGKRSNGTSGAGRSGAGKKGELGIINPNAAGIDISSTEHFVAVPYDRAEKNVRSFGSFTRDMHELAGWLKACRIDTVAMESTGIYWVQLYMILEEYGFDVYLVNPKHIKNVTGRKSDVSDCQWIQQLHSYGLLSRSFQPDLLTRELRSYIRHRQNLIEGLSREVLHIQKALEEMNLKIYTVISDITGKSGIRIIEAILSGQRDAKTLSSMADVRIRATKEEIEKSLEGNYREDSLFSLRQAYELYKVHLTMIRECDMEIEKQLEKLRLSEQEEKTDLEVKKKTLSKLMSKKTGMKKLRSFKGKQIRKIRVKMLRNSMSGSI